jgi:multiple sugar transport system substrate-binding protein
MPLSDLRASAGRLGLACAVIFLLLAHLSGCGGAVPTPESVTIAFVYPEADADHYEPLVQEFSERYPYIALELRPTTWDVLADLSADDADVFAPGVFTIRRLQEQGEILSLDPFIEQDASFELADFYPGTIELLTSEGKTWAIPVGIDMNVMYYSRDLFDQYGVPYPESGWTWDDFLDSALAIRDPDAGVFGYTTIPGYADTYVFVYQHGGRIFDDPRDPTRTTFDDPLTVEALEWYARLFHEYDVAPTQKEARAAFGGGQYGFYEGLRHGKAGMWMLTLSDRGGLTWPVEWYVDWGMAPLPRDVYPVTNIWGDEGYAISSQTQHPDACWQWILFLSKHMHYRLMPARRSLAESAAYEQLVGREVASVARASMENVVAVSSWNWFDFLEAMEIYEEAVDQIVNGDATPQEAMDWAQREAERVNPSSSATP